MICGEGMEVIGRTAEDVLEFVLDLRRYAEADHKIRRIRSIERHGNTGVVKHGGQLRGLPGPPVQLRFVLTPHSRLEFVNVRSGPTGWLFHFEGTFECAEVAGGTRVTHRECFQFAAAVRWLLEPFLRDWLAKDTVAEMARMKAILER